ncbi:MAG: APC family permease [Armatimonadetes bacterium]|nr:APC family permease [Armatimonadota bacterium]
MAGSGDFAGWGGLEVIDDLGLEAVKVGPAKTGHSRKLGEVASTAICGNDITSSCLYVAALATLYAGPYAFLCLAGVAALLYVFRSIYAEVGSALPLNGGAYNALLNTTSKYRASLAACLTILSYMATACISAYEAMHYLHNIWHGLPVLVATVVVLGIFMSLSLVGITESAAVAIGIFGFHMLTLVLLVGSAVVRFGFDFSIFAANWAQGPPAGSVSKALFFGFAAGLLGISGFESSANFIEEQKAGVFPKTLRNMWVAVAVFNPLISLLAMCVMPMREALDATGTGTREDFLAYMGEITGGNWLRWMVSIDAVLVLSGAVLTAYVGVTGLIRRMALDRCLPQFLLRENRSRGTNHWIIIGFFCLCCSIVFITSRGRRGAAGVLETLAGVYTLSFLGVMALFAVGNMLLKVKRQRLPRAVRASWIGVVLALVAVLVGLVGNALIDFPDRMSVFLVYFAAAVAVVTVTFFSARILKALLAAIAPVSQWLLDTLDRVKNERAVFFTKGDNLANLNRAALYVLQNEQMRGLKVVHVFERDEEVEREYLERQLRTIDEVYPELRIDLVLVKGKFGPELIERLSKRMRVPKNYMFIGTPGDRFPHNIAELGGVRVII